MCTVYLCVVRCACRALGGRTELGLGLGLRELGSRCLMHVACCMRCEARGAKCLRFLPRPSCRMELVEFDGSWVHARGLELGTLLRWTPAASRCGRVFSVRSSRGLLTCEPCVAASGGTEERLKPLAKTTFTHGWHRLEPIVTSESRPRSGEPVRTRIVRASIELPPTWG